MREFGSLREFANFTAERAVASRLAFTASLGVMAEYIKKTAQSYFGIESELPPPLSEYTQAERASLGFSPTQTLLRSGSLRDSYETAQIGTVAGVGSPDPRALWHELGFYNVRTKTEVPARPVLMKAAVETTDATFAIVSGAVAAGAGLMGGPRSAFVIPTLADSIGLGSTPFAAGYVMKE